MYTIIGAISDEVFWVASLFCSGVPVRSYWTCNSHIARDHTQVYNWPNSPDVIIRIILDVPLGGQSHCALFSEVTRRLHVNQLPTKMVAASDVHARSQYNLASSSRGITLRWCNFFFYKYLVASRETELWVQPCNNLHVLRKCWLWKSQFSHDVSLLVFMR